MLQRTSQERDRHDTLLPRTGCAGKTRGCGHNIFGSSPGFCSAYALRPRLCRLGFDRIWRCLPMLIERSPLQFWVWPLVSLIRVDGGPFVSFSCWRPFRLSRCSFSRPAGIRACLTPSSRHSAQFLEWSWPMVCCGFCACAIKPDGKLLMTRGTLPEPLPGYRDNLTNLSLGS